MHYTEAAFWNDIVLCNKPFLAKICQGQVSFDLDYPLSTHANMIAFYIYKVRTEGMSKHLLYDIWCHDVLLKFPVDWHRSLFMRKVLSSHKELNLSGYNFKICWRVTSLYSNIFFNKILLLIISTFFKSMIFAQILHCYKPCEGRNCVYFAHHGLSFAEHINSIKLICNEYYLVSKLFSSRSHLRDVDR